MAFSLETETGVEHDGSSTASQSSGDTELVRFSISAARLGLPDTTFISYGEMVDEGQQITQAVSKPVIGDGDNGYGNAMNVKRTVKGYIKAGFAGIILEDISGSYCLEIFLTFSKIFVSGKPSQSVFIFFFALSVLIILSLPLFLDQFSQDSF
ncbi:hypothetical protein DITRI_Ditri16bG0100300 [Diplodiscus trichospermus]